MWRNMNRRQYIGVAATAGVGLLAGCGGRDESPDDSSDVSPDETAEPDSGSEDTEPSGETSSRGTYGIEFDRIVHAVDDLGMDPTGESAIDDALDRAYQKGTLVRFPPGEYQVSETRSIEGSVSRFGIQGTGESHSDVVFQFPDEEDSYWFIHQNGGENVLLDNFTLDSDEKYVGIRCRTNGGSLIQDVEWRGFLPEKTTDLGQLLDPGCLAADGVNTVRRVNMGRDGAHVSGHYTRTDVHSMTGIRFYGTGTRSGVMGHAGETVLEDVQIHQMGSNGVRHTHGDGVVTINGGMFKNCGLSALRIHNGDHSSKDSSITDAKIIIDHDNAGPIGSGNWSRNGVNGILLDSTGHGYSQPTYEGCEIICQSVATDDGWGLIRATDTGRSNPGGGVFKDCRVINRTNLQTVRIDSRKPEADPPQGFTFDGVEIYLSGDAQPLDSVVSIDEGWDSSCIKDSTIFASSGTVDGLTVRNCKDVTVENTTISVPRYMITGVGSSQIIRQNISTEAPEELPF